MTIIPLAPSLLTGSSSLPGSADGPSVDPLTRIVLPYLALLRAGFCLPSVLPRTRCALTAPFHPYPSTRVRLRVRESKGGIFSVPLSFELPRPAVTRRTALRSSDFPRPPSPAFARSLRLRRGYGETSARRDHLALCGNSYYRTRASSTRPTLFGDRVLLELLVEVAARRADDLGGLRDVPGVLAQLLDEELPLGRLLELAQRARRDTLAAALGGGASAMRRRRRACPCQSGRRRGDRPRRWCRRAS